MTKRTRRAISAHKNSLQSRLRSIITEPGPPEPLHTRDAFLQGKRSNVVTIECCCLGKRAGDTKDALDHGPSIAHLARPAKSALVGDFERRVRSCCQAP